VKQVLILALLLMLTGCVKENNQTMEENENTEANSHAIERTTDSEKSMMADVEDKTTEENAPKSKRTGECSL